MSSLGSLFSSPEERQLRRIKRDSEGDGIAGIARLQVISLLESLKGSDESKRRRAGIAVGRVLGDWGVLVLLRPLLRAR